MIHSDDKFADDDESTSPKERRSSEPPGLLSPSALPYTPPVGGRGSSRHGSIPEGSPLTSRLQPEPYRSTNNTLSVDTLGLTLVHTHLEPFVDLIFVHGLGGAPMKTWSWQRDPQNFWPAWLGQEAELCNSRIFTFGYNADFSGQHTSLNILDFAKELLFRMKTYSNVGSANDQPIGKVGVFHPNG